MKTTELYFNKTKHLNRPKSSDDLQVLSSVALDSFRYTLPLYDINLVRVGHLGFDNDITIYEPEQN